jgi:large subunit ribosomal protein L22
VRVSATAKYLRGSTRKADLVVRAIRGRRAEDAAAILRFMPQGAARDVARVLASRAFPIHKPMTHITIVLEDREA